LNEGVGVGHCFLTADYADGADEEGGTETSYLSV
jgi:hypothetical protein